MCCGIQLLIHDFCSLNWQHQLCKNPRPNPDIKTLFVDHTCGPPNGARPAAAVNNPLVGMQGKGGAFPPLGAHSVRNFCSYVVTSSTSPEFHPLICLVLGSSRLSFSLQCHIVVSCHSLFSLPQLPLPVHWLGGWPVPTLTPLRRILPLDQRRSLLHRILVNLYVLRNSHSVDVA